MIYLHLPPGAGGGKWVGRYKCKMEDVGRVGQSDAWGGALPPGATSCRTVGHVGHVGRRVTPRPTVRHPFMPLHPGLWLSSWQRLQAHGQREPRSARGSDKFATNLPGDFTLYSYRNHKATGSVAQSGSP